MLNEITWILCALIWISTCVAIVIISLKEKNEKKISNSEVEKEKYEVEDDYETPCF